jgi:hypothetical protein
MPIPVVCPSCAGRLRAPDNAAGRGWPSLKESFVSRAFWRNFRRRFSATALLGRFSVAFSRCFGIAVLGLMSLTVFLFEVVEPFFSARLHPYTSLRESIRPYGGRPGRNLTPSSLLRPSRTAWPSQSDRRSAAGAESSGHLRLALQARASSSSEEKPMQPPPRFPHSVISSPSFSRPHRRSTMFLPGEAESGSGTVRSMVGTQPDKE